MKTCYRFKSWMSIHQILASATVIFVANGAYAGFEKGNGGDGFHCANAQKIFYLAEEIEATPIWGIHLQHGADDFLDDLFNSQIQKLATALPKLAQSLEQDIKWVQNHIQLISNAKLINLDDDLLAWIPQGCSLEQVAIQTKTDLFVIQSYWQMMQKWQQKLLITHEALHRSINKISNEQNIKLKNGQIVRLINLYLWQRSENEMLPNSLMHNISSMTSLNLN